MAELGWLGVLVPESAGGLGLGLVDLVVLQEELGRAAVPRPVPVVCGGSDPRRGASRRGRIARGSRVGSRARDGGGGGARARGPARNSCTRRHVVAAAPWTLEGTKPLVLDGATADWAFVVANDGDGLGTFLLDSPGGRDRCRRST